MRLIQFLPFLGLASATLTARQASVIEGVFSQIASDVSAVDNAVKNYGSDGSALSSANDQLVADMKSGISTIQGSQDLSTGDAVTAASSVSGLSTQIQNTVNDLISAKSKIVASGQGGAVYAALQQQKTLSQQLADAVTAKIPTALQGTASGVAGDVTSQLDKGVQAYSDQASSSSSSGSSSGNSAPSGGSTAVPSGTMAVYPSAIPSATGTSGPIAYTGAASVQHPLIGAAVGAAGFVVAVGISMCE